MSWIWYSSHLGDVPGGVEECIPYSCLQTHARAHRWCEECKLLKVEMECLKCTLKHNTNLWLSRAKSAAEGVALINASEGADFRGHGNTQNSERGRERCLQSQ
ncbi:hypothetical protein IW261DRAFT_1424537 [Armillaria novae-zelandiae]|uniref:Uncharacterized protein n=1 Tax=Armillaria novae-zelandiae TaxID=153914 RepID=A0AA39NV31_9AGAR|nr:hypothetical protein IW261DRAFT_1424537 [Armillaria novae-zelandiae]